VLADRSCKLSPHGWAKRAVQAFNTFGADRIVAERNFGGQMVESTIESVDQAVPAKLVNASRGKVQRAEPIAALYEQHRVHHVGALAELEDQMTTWTPAQSGSPDRMDALVWALTELNGGMGRGAAFLQFMKRDLEARGIEVPTETWRERSERLTAQQAGVAEPLLPGAHGRRMPPLVRGPRT
jgi:hypothetical protein